VCRVGKATAIPTDATNAKLKVTFYWPFSADYWIIALGPSLEGMYQWAVVGSPCRKYLWILSRNEKMDDFQFYTAAESALRQVKLKNTL
jgi:apolipoprotein D and lipocalin family protein